jgi:PhoH-like ATPase
VRRIRKDAHHPRHHADCRDIGFLPGRWRKRCSRGCSPRTTRWSNSSPDPKAEKFEHKKQSARKHHTPSPSSDSAPPNGKTNRPYEALLQSGLLEVEAIAHIRGRSLPRAVFIVDEAQQLTPHEAKTLVTRMGKGSKIIMIGDLAQIDNPYVGCATQTA